MLEAQSLGWIRDGQSVLQDVTLALGPGECVGLMGANGAGKSSLLRLMAGLAPPTAGRTRMDGQDLAALQPKARARRIAYLPQTRSIAWPVAVRDLVALGRLPHGDENSAAVARAIAACGLAGFEHRAATALSEGEKARACLARALSTQADYLLADEPLAALDPHHQKALGRALRAEAERGAGVLFALHDPNLALALCDRVIVLAAGRVLADGPPSSALTEATMAAAFGVAARLIRDGQDRAWVWRTA